MVYAAERRPYHCSGSDSVVCHRTVWISEKEQISLCLFHGHEEPGDSVDRICLDTDGFHSVLCDSGRRDESGIPCVPAASGSGTVPAVSGHPASSGGSGQCSASVSGTAGRFSHEGLSEDDQV